MTSRLLRGEEETAQFAEWLVQQLDTRYAHNAVVFLHGDLGAGKTTLVRGMLHALGHSGVVKSPTYTLLEPYTLPCGPIFHFDLYRINSPEELEFVGIDEIVDGPGLKLFEWPRRAAQWLPQPDVEVTLSVVSTGGSTQAGTIESTGVSTVENLPDSASIDGANQRQVQVEFHN